MRHCDELPQIYVLLTSSSMGRHAYLDVRDLAHAIVLAITKPQAGNQRFIISGGHFRWQDFGEHSDYLIFLLSTHASSHSLQLSSPTP